MASATYNVSLVVAGNPLNRSVVRTGDHPNVYDITLPAAKAGTLSTRTDNDTGVVTVASGHGVTTSNLVDVYWITGSTGRRYGMTVTGTTGTTISIDGGSGDNLPTALDAVTIAPQVVINTTIDGDNINILGLMAFVPDSTATSKAHVTFKDSGAAAIANLDLTANVPRVYDIDGGDTNVFTGNPIVTAHATNGNSTYDATLTINSLETATV